MARAGKLSVVVFIAPVSHGMLRACTGVTPKSLLMVRSIHHRQLHCYARFAHVLLRPLLHGRGSIDGGGQY